MNTPGGVFHIRRDDRGGATARGQLPFFAEYLNATGLFEDWVRGCPLSYLSPNAPRVVDVLGTWILNPKPIPNARVASQLPIGWCSLHGHETSFGM